MLSQLMSRAEGVLQASSPEAASDAFFAALQPLGATYLQTRLYQRPAAALTSRTHWSAGGFIRRSAPGAWSGSAAFNYVCFDCNPLLSAIREGRTRYRFSDFAPHSDPRYGAYWDAMGEAGIHDAHCATSYGGGGGISSLHLGFQRRDFAPEETFAIQMAGLLLTERLLALAEPVTTPAVTLTTRERDSLALVAEGKTDWEISVILSVSEPTARFHVDNARRKLGAVNRAQAVARLVNLRLL